MLEDGGCCGIGSWGARPRTLGRCWPGTGSPSPRSASYLASPTCTWPHRQTPPAPSVFRPPPGTRVKMEYYCNSTRMSSHFQLYICIAWKFNLFHQLSGQDLHHGYLAGRPPRLHLLQPRPASPRSWPPSSSPSSRQFSTRISIICAGRGAGPSGSY